ncbi:MAG: hypothetical protein WA874_00300 [Chryseosolibacter sp.]
MNTSDIDLMLAEKGKPCLSIVIPTHQYSRDRMQNPEIIEKAIQKATSLLANSAWPKDQIRQMESKFNALLESVDNMRLQEGMAIFISPNMMKIHFLPFAVKEKIMLGQTFEIRDLVYFGQLLKPYFLLALSKNRIRLFKGSGRDLQEVINNDFPKDYVEEYEYERPSLGSSSGSSLKSYERDKSILQESREKGFFRNADAILNKYLKENTSLFVAGVEEAIANFQDASHHLKNIAGKIEGNYDYDALHPLAETMWKKIQESVQNENQALLIKLEKYTGRQLAVEGIIDVWRTAKEGKGLILLVEKDYQVMAYQHAQNSSVISLSPPAGKYQIIIDAADDVIEIVKEKGGSVAILEPGQLQNFNHIALLLRYED